MKPKFILLHPQDNILVCCRQADANEAIALGKEKITLLQDMELGHKIARQSLSMGDKIIKYGVAIGSALQAVRPGEHVHLHNMRSDYIAPHTRERLQESGESK